MRQQLSRYIPGWDWLLHHPPRYLMGDITAGIIVASLLIPQSMGYALLAGLPPQMGLYASVLPPIIYALWVPVGCWLWGLSRLIPSWSQRRSPL